jgi:hypothetical protein
MGLAATLLALEAARELEELEAELEEASLLLAADLREP